MASYRKKPVVVEAEQFLTGKEPMPKGVCVEISWTNEGSRYNIYFVTTIHGQKAMVISGDWIIQEPDGIHAYPCKPDIFEATYELVEDDPWEGPIQALSDSAPRTAESPPSKQHSPPSP